VASTVALATLWHNKQHKATTATVSSGSSFGKGAIVDQKYNKKKQQSTGDWQ